MRIPLNYASTFALIAFAFFFSAHAVSAATYYVDATGGNDSNDGLTTGTAWKTIAKVSGLACGNGVGQLAPGDSVLFKGGEVWREQLTIPCSGTASGTISFGSYGVGRPTLRGYTTFGGVWTDLGGGLYSQSVPAATGYGFIEDGILRQSASDSTCADGTWFRGAGPVLYYRPASGTPTDHTLYYTSLQTALLAIDKSHITVRDFEVEGYSSQSAPGFSALYFYGSSTKIYGIVVENILAHDIANRVLAIDNAAAPIVRNSELYRAQTGVYLRSSTTDGLVRANRVYTIRPYLRGAGDMYALAVGSSGNNIGNIVEFNEVWDVGDVAIRTNMDAAIAGWNASAQSSGVWRYNYIHDNQTGCINTGNRGGGSLVYGNILVNCGNASNVGKNSGVYVSNASLDPDAVSVYNNTV